MKAEGKSLRAREFVENASGRLYYRLRREYYAKMSELAAAGEKGAALPRIMRTLTEREQEIAKLTADLAAMRDLALRARADLDNSRKRFQREKAETIKYAAEQLVGELIVVLDNLERAVASAISGADVAGVREGVQMVLDQFLGILRANGLEIIPSDGQQFDPHYHEAIGTEEREDVVDNQVVATVQKGYTLRGRVVRPAMVRVGRAVCPAPAADVVATPPPEIEGIPAAMEEVAQEQTEQAGEEASDNCGSSTDK